eukprot:gene5284-biopygen17692
MGRGPRRFSLSPQGAEQPRGKGTHPAFSKKMCFQGEYKKMAREARRGISRGSCPPPPSKFAPALGARRRECTIHGSCWGVGGFGPLRTRADAQTDEGTVQLSNNVWGPEFGVFLRPVGGNGIAVYYGCITKHPMMGCLNAWEISSEANWSRFASSFVGGGKLLETQRGGSPRNGGYHIHCDFPTPRRQPTIITTAFSPGRAAEGEAPPPQGRELQQAWVTASTDAAHSLPDPDPDDSPQVVPPNLCWGTSLSTLTAEVQGEAWERLVASHLEPSPKPRPEFLQWYRRSFPTPILLRELVACGANISITQPEEPAECIWPIETWTAHRAPWSRAGFRLRLMKERRIDRLFGGMAISTARPARG